MNRSALVIKMLNYLYAYGRNEPVSREELAEVLETNVRNILEFKKELEVAGYSIESVRGKEGGYILKSNSIFPSLALNDKEKEVIHKVIEYLHQQSNFDGIATFEQAMMKLIARMSTSLESSNTIYLSESRTRLNAYEMEMLNLIQHARNEQLEIEVKYSTERKESEVRQLRPYEIIVNSEGYYVLAEDITPKKKHVLKVFKIIEDRMKYVDISKRRFVRDEDFKLSEYIGAYSLMKDEYEVELKVQGLGARLLYEQDLERTIEKYWREDALYIRFIMEGKYRVKSFILSLGSQCEVISPLSLQEEIKEELLASLKQYK